MGVKHDTCWDGGKSPTRGNSDEDVTCGACIEGATYKGHQFCYPW